MQEKLIRTTTVAYGDVDRQEVMLLPRVFKMLQDAAIEHANQFGAGTDVVATREESWVLHRIAARVDRYPRAGEALQVETWSTGIRGFKGYREFRVYDAQRQLIVTASSLWLYVSLRTKAIIRVPRPVADGFLIGPEPAWCPELERLSFDAPTDGSGARLSVHLRYSDFDVNDHVNNAAYADLLQTALWRAGGAAHPRAVALRFAKAIPLAAADVDVLVHPGLPMRFRIERGGVVFAEGEVSGESVTTRADPPRGGATAEGAVGGGG